MVTLNLFKEDGTYVCSVQKETHEQCCARAEEAYPDLYWSWDYNYRIKHKRFAPSPNGRVQTISLKELFG